LHFLVTMSTMSGAWPCTERSIWTAHRQENQSMA
jgi:hypothetical protein